VAGHEVHRVSQVFPGTSHPWHLSLPTEAPFGADLAGDAGHLAGESVELIDHRIDGVFQLQDLPPHVHRDLAGEVAVGDGGGDVGNIADLGRQIAGHRVHAVGQVFPGTCHAGYLGLPTQPALGADLASDAGHLPGEGVKLVDHRVDDLAGFEQLPLER